MKEYIKLLRPHQWVKNVFILLPLFFAFRFLEYEITLKTILVGLGFSLVASSIYILNDLFDIEEDKKHPTKKYRPLAAGTISQKSALALMSLVLCMGLITVFSINFYSFLFVLGYFGMNILYSIRLKHVPILDICIISIGFVLRLFIGAQVGDVFLSKWIILMTFLLALFLALAKRRDDVLLALDGKEVRKSIDGYNLEFINGAMMIMASVTIVSYISYTVSTDIMQRFGSEHLYLTVFFVILGVFRYMQITFVKEKSGSPSRILLTDPFLQLTLLGWIASFVVLIYFSKG